jgi:hypothetical protein
MRLTRNGKPFAPKAGAPGSVLTFTHAGREITGQVWSDADKFGQQKRTVWIVADGIAYAVNSAGRVLHVQDNRREKAAA